MKLVQVLCYLTIFSNAAVCRQVTTKIPTTTTTTTTTVPTTSRSANLSNPLAPSRLESIKNSYSELNLLSKTNPSDFIFDFGNASAGISTGTGGRTVSATISINILSYF